jgi:S-layer protein
MAYTSEQLALAYKAVHVGIAPNATIMNTFQTQAMLSANGQVTDAQLLSNIVNSVDDSTALALVSYQFFTGKAPTAAGLAYLVNSPANPTDLNDAYYAKFNLENRYINFAANLGLRGEGAGAFSTKYAAMSFSDYVASIYETIIGSSYAKEAGIDPAAAIAYLVETKDAVLAIARDAGMITADMTPTQVDLGLKAAMAGLVMAAGIKADVGLYAAIANNFMVAMAQGSAAYGANMLANYWPVVESASHGTGHAVDRGMDLPFPTTEQPRPVITSFVLTPGVDNVQGSGLNDTITGTNLTFNGTDVINGGGGNDTLTVAASGVGAYILPGATVTNVKTATLSNTADLSANTTSWTGLSQLTMTAVGATTATSAATTDVSITATLQDAGMQVVNGGRDVSVTTTGASTGLIDIGSGTAAAGAVTVSRTTTGAVNAGSITVNAAGNVSVTQASSNTSGTQTNGAVTVNGGLSTTSVTVKADPRGANGLGGTVAGNTISIHDVNAGTATLGKITTVTLEGASSGATITDTALTTLNLKNYSNGNVTIDNTAAGAPGATTLNLSLTDTASGTIRTQGVYTTINITTAGTNTTFALNPPGMTTLNVTGTGSYTLYGFNGAALQTLNVTGSVDFSGYFQTASTLTTIDGSTATGDLDLRIFGIGTVTTGAGNDTITLASNAITANVSLGDGDDTMDLFSLSAMYMPSGIMDGGTGTDTVHMGAIAAAAFSGSGVFATHFTGFERLSLRNITNQTINVAQLGGYHYVTLAGGSNGLTLNGLASGDTLVLTGAGTSILLGNWGGVSDSLNLKLEDAAGASLNYAAGSLNATGIETYTITTHDGRATPTGAMEKIILSDNGVKTINASGNAGLDVTVSSSAVFTTLDASAITLGGLKATLFNAASAVTIKGAATADNAVELSGFVTDLTYTGGAGVDTLTLTGGHNTVTLGGGNDVVNLQTAPASELAPTTITDFARGDSIGFTLAGGPPAAGALGAAIAWGGSLSTTLDLAATSTTAAGAAVVHWFTDGANTYVVVDTSNNSTFQTGADYVVKLTGVLDLSTAAMSGSVLTF